MLWLFGQIWLWLLAAFGLGVLLTWLVLGAVHRKQLAEARAGTAAALPPLEPRAADYDDFADLRDDGYPRDAAYPEADSDAYPEPGNAHADHANAAYPEGDAYPEHDSDRDEPYLHTHPADAYDKTPPSHDPYSTPAGREAYPAHDYPGELHPAEPYPPLHANDGYPRDDQGYPAEEYDYGYPAEDEDPDRAYRGQLNGAPRAQEIDWPVEHAQPEWPTDEDWPPAEPRRRNW